MVISSDGLRLTTVEVSISKGLRLIRLGLKKPLNLTMKIALQYVSDSNGKHQAIQMPINDWKKLLSRLKKYDQLFKIKSDLNDAFQEVELLKKSTINKQNLTDFLNEI